jgi:hypothetical protein
MSNAQMYDEEEILKGIEKAEFVKKGAWTWKNTRYTTLTSGT